MAQPRILIIDDAATRTISIQIRTILEQESRYQLEDSMSSSANPEPDPDLIIVLLPLSNEQADPVLAGLESRASLAPLLIVVDPEQLRDLAGRFPATGDLLVTPVRALELLARTERLLSHARRQEPARVKSSVTDTAGLSELVGEAPAFAEAADLRIRVPPSPREPGADSMKLAKARAVDEFEKSYVAEMLRMHSGNVTQAAQQAQKERRSFGRLVKKHHLPKR